MEQQDANDKQTMKKSFTREDDDSPEEAPEPALARLPQGNKNYITPAGFERLRQELKHLTKVERPKVQDITGDHGVQHRLSSLTPACLQHS